MDLIWCQGSGNSFFCYCGNCLQKTDRMSGNRIRETQSSWCPTWQKFKASVSILFWNSSRRSRAGFSKMCEVWSPNILISLSTPLHCVLILVIPEQTEIRDKPLACVSAFVLHSAGTLHRCFCLAFSCPVFLAEGGHIHRKIVFHFLSSHWHFSFTDISGSKGG